MPEHSLPKHQQKNTKKPTALGSFGERLSALRRKQNLTQTEAAKLLGISRPALSQLESGASMPSFETLRKAHEVYGASYDYLLEGKAEKVSKQNRPDKIVSITVDSHNDPNIVLVPVKAQAGYAKARLQDEAFQHYPVFNLPGHQYRNQSFRAFEATGDSMEPTISSGDILICTQVANWKHLWPGELFVLVLYDDVLVKRVQHLRTEANSVRLQSDNSFYQPFELELSEVVEIWRVYAKLTQNLPAPDNRLERIRNLIEQMNHHHAQRSAERGLPETDPSK